VLARTSHGDFTIGDLSRVLAAQLPFGASQQQINQRLIVPMTDLQAMAGQFLAETELAREVKETSPSLIQSWKNDLIETEGREAFGVMQQRMIKEASHITDEQARSYYESNKILYKTPLSFTMRHLSLTAYVPYTSQPGDTLESIAKSITGTESAVAGILTDTVAKLPRWVPENERYRRPMIPLSPGERLLVPMSRQKRDELRKMIQEKILPQLQKGVSFEQLCKLYSEAEDKGAIIGPLPFGGSTQMLPEILEAARTLPIGKVSDIIETPKGFELIQIVSRTDEHQKTFAEAKPDVLEEMRKKRAQDAIGDKMSALWPKLKVDVDAIADQKTDPKKVVVSTKERQWTREEIESMVGESIGITRSPVNIMQALESNMAINNQLLIENAKEQGVYNDPAFLQRLEIVKDHALAQKLIERNAQAAQKGITEAVARKFYDSHRAAFTPAASYKVRQIVTRLDPNANLSDPASRRAAEQAAISALREKTRDIKTQDDFTRAVQLISEDPASKQKMGFVGEVTEGYRGGIYAETLKQLPVKTVSEPFVQGDLVYVLWIDEKTTPQPQPFDSVKNVIRQQMQKEAASQTEAQLLRKAMQKILFEPVKKM